jgi:hypothetical protein
MQVKEKSKTDKTVMSGFRGQLMMLQAEQHSSATICGARLFCWVSHVGVKNREGARCRVPNTVRWSNFDRLDPKMGVFLQSTEAIPCGHVFK